MLPKLSIRQAPLPRYDRGPAPDTRDQLPRRKRSCTRGDAAAISKRCERYRRAVSSLQVPRPSQLRVVVVDFGLFCGAGSLRTLFKKCPTTSCPSWLVSRCQRDYAVSPNTLCIGADVIIADFIVGERLGCDRVSSTSLSALLADLHLAWGPPPEISHRIVYEANAPRLLYCDARDLFRISVSNQVHDVSFKWWAFVRGDHGMTVMKCHGRHESLQTALHAYIEGA